MHLALPQATFSIEIKFLLHMCNFLLRLSSCLTASLHHLLPVSLHLPSFRSSLISISSLLPLSLSSVISLCRTSSCHSWHLFPLRQSPADSSRADLSKLFLLPCKHPLLTTDREREREGVLCQKVFVSPTKQTWWKVWPQFHNGWHFHAAVCFHY